MKIRALGTATPQLANLASSPAPAERASAPVPARVCAAVIERDAQGVPTRLSLPGPLAERQVSLYVRGPNGPLWAAAVIDDGRICHDFRSGSSPDKHELARIRPGTKIVASCDMAGRVIALGALP